MISLSGVVIAGNAEDDIVGCLESLAFCDEVLVISDATDHTDSLARKAGAVILKTKEKSFAEKRNLGLYKAKGDWILYIDTDERISSELKDSIQKTVTGQHQFGRLFDAYTLQRQNYYFGKHPWPTIEYLPRLFRTSVLDCWYGKLHESPKLKTQKRDHFSQDDGSFGILDGFLLHYTHKNLRQMLSKTIIWSDVEAKLRYDAGHPPMTWWRFPRVILTGFWNSYISQGGWKVGTVGLLESMYQGFSMFVTYARLWEMQMKLNNHAKETI